MLIRMLGMCAFVLLVGSVGCYSIRSDLGTPAGVYISSDGGHGGRILHLCPGGQYVYEHRGHIVLRSVSDGSWHSAPGNTIVLNSRYQDLQDISGTVISDETVDSNSLEAPLVISVYTHLSLQKNSMSLEIEGRNFAASRRRSKGPGPLPIRDDASPHVVVLDYHPANGDIKIITRAHGVGGVLREVERDSLSSLIADVNLASASQVAIYAPLYDYMYIYEVINSDAAELRRGAIVFRDRQYLRIADRDPACSFEEARIEGAFL